jgi:hypothetical protein
MNFLAVGSRRRATSSPFHASIVDRATLAGVFGASKVISVPSHFHLYRTRDAMPYPTAKTANQNAIR